MKRNQFIVTVACVLFTALLTRLWAQSPNSRVAEPSQAWEYRVVLLADLQEFKDENNDGLGDLGPAELAKALNQKINDLGRDRWEFVLERDGWLDYWLFRRPAKN